VFSYWKKGGGAARATKTKKERKVFPMDAGGWHRDDEREKQGDDSCVIRADCGKGDTLREEENGPDLGGEVRP